MEEDDEYTPLQDQRVFGAGIKRKRIVFVPATSPPPTEGSSSSSLPSNQPTSSAADRYLSIVLAHKQQIHEEEGGNANPGDGGTVAEEEEEDDDDAVVVQCAVCKQPVTRTTSNTTTTTTVLHESSIAHQVCLEHSQPPSHLDRRHVGVKYLGAYGWDPDSGRGLGARGEGIRLPIKAAREKHDTVGLREWVDQDDEDEDHKQRQKLKLKLKKKPVANKKAAGDGVVVRLNAKQVRNQEVVSKKRAEALRTAFYADVDVDKYLLHGV